METLYHEVGHHKAAITHGISKYKGEAYAEKYTIDLSTAMEVRVHDVSVLDEHSRPCRRYYWAPSLDEIWMLLGYYGAHMNCTGSAQINCTTAQQRGVDTFNQFMRMNICNLLILRNVK